MEQKYFEDYFQLLDILQSKLSDKQKYLKLKSLEPNYLEYILLENHIQHKHGRKLENATEFISSYFLLESDFSSSGDFDQFIILALFAIKAILVSEEKTLAEIPEFRLFSTYFFSKEPVLISPVQ